MPTYPSHNPTLTLTSCQLKQNIGLRETKHSSSDKTLEIITVLFFSCTYILQHLPFSAGYPTIHSTGGHQCPWHIPRNSEVLFHCVLVAEIHNNKEKNNDWRCASTCTCSVFSVKGLWHMCFAEYQIDCLQSAFSLKIHLVLDLIQRDCKPRCFFDRAYALVSRGKRLRRSRD